MKKVFMAMAAVALLITACNNYGKKKSFGKADLYYTENITEAEADSTGAFLEEMGYFGDEKELSVQVDKVDSTYKLRFVVLETYQTTDSSLDNNFKLIATLASYRVFDGKKVEVDFCDDELKTKRTIK